MTSQCGDQSNGAATCVNCSSALHYLVTTYLSPAEAPDSKFPLALQYHKAALENEFKLFLEKIHINCCKSCPSSITHSNFMPAITQRESADAEGRTHVNTGLAGGSIVLVIVMLIVR